MRLHRFFLLANFSQHLLEINDKEILHQWRNVLRLKKNQKVILFNGKEEVLAVLKELQRNFAIVEILEKKENFAEPRKYVILYCALLKKDKFELVAEKVTEIGVKEIVPLLTQRTIKKNFKRRRIEKIITEAAEQSGRSTLPVLSNPLTLKEAMIFAQQNEINFFFDPEGRAEIRKLVISKSKIGIFIGPEGGWTEEEKEMAEHQGLIMSNLGKLTLRSETAAIVSSYLAVHSNELFAKKVIK